MTEHTSAVRHKTFYRELESILRQIDEEQGLESMLTTILSQIGDQVLGAETGISSGRLYRRDHGDYVIVRSFGARGRALLGERVPSSYPIVTELSHERVTYTFPDDERFDRDIEGRLGVQTSAAFALDPDREYIAAFGIEEGADVNEVMLTLNTLRYAIAHRLKELSLEGQIREAKDIQLSLLPRTTPPFEGFELAGVSEPAETVGGDIYDFLPVGEHLMGVAVGDASGHGLPAALQARDVVTGLRMGVEKDLKVASVMQRLNRVIHRSGLTSRFVSLFYGELEPSGNFVYVNAGHDPGLLLRADGRTEQLRSTGIVMGPLADAKYRRELVRMDPGDVLLLYTDGVVERTRPLDDEEFGLERFEEVTRRALADGAALAEIPGTILAELRSFGEEQPWSDDVTVVLIRRNK